MIIIYSDNPVLQCHGDADHMIDLHKPHPCLNFHLQAFVGSKREYPVLQCHGDADQMVKLQYGTMTYGLLNGYCKNLIFKQYSGLGHSSNIPVSTNIIILCLASQRLSIQNVINTMPFSSDKLNKHVHLRVHIDIYTHVSAQFAFVSFPGGQIIMEY